MAHALRYLTALVALAGAVWGQGTPPRVVHFTVFSARPIADLSFVPLAKAAPQKLVFYPTARSPRYDYRGTMPLQFADPSGQVVAEATIPADITDALLLFSAVEPPPAAKTDADARKSKPALRYQIAVLDDGATRHGPGGLAIINFSGLELSGNVGPHAVLLKPGLNPTLPIGRSAKIALRAASKGKTYQSYVDSVELGNRQRALLILFPPYYKGSLEAQSRLLIDEAPAAGPGR
jgi:hypothetical protein